jgi:hypothetical protein
VHPRGDLARGADRDRREVEHHRLDVDERPVADADRAVLAVEGRTHDDALADVPQRPAEQPIALVPCSRRSPIELRKQFLHAVELGFVVGVVGDVQLAPQHPLALRDRRFRIETDP